MNGGGGGGGGRAQSPPPTRSAPAKPRFLRVQIDQEFAPLNVKQTKLKLILPVVGGRARRRRSRRRSNELLHHGGWISLTRALTFVYLTITLPPVLHHRPLQAPSWTTASDVLHALTKQGLLRQGGAQKQELSLGGYFLSDQCLLTSLRDDDEVRVCSEEVSP